MKKDDTNIKIVCATIIGIIISSFLNAAASGTLFDSNEVSYDNTNSGINASNVQGAVDKLYAAATDYSNISSRLSALETYKSDHFSGTVTSRFADNGLQLGVTSNSYGWADWYYNGTNVGNIYSPNASTFNISTQNTLNINGSPVKVNGVDYSTSSSSTLTIDTSNTRTASSTTAYMQRWGKLVVITLNDVCPKANAQGGFVTFIKGIPESVGVVNNNISSNTDGAAAAYRMRVTGTNLQWSYSPGSDNCAFAAGEIVYIAK